MLKSKQTQFRELQRLHNSLTLRPQSSNPVAKVSNSREMHQNQHLNMNMSFINIFKGHLDSLIINSISIVIGANLTHNLSLIPSSNSVTFI